MGIKYNIFKDEINHKDFFLGPHVHFFMESPKLVNWAVFSILCLHNMASVSIFKSAFSQHVSFSSVVSRISLTNCSFIFLFFRSFLFSLIQHSLNSFLFPVSVYYIVCAAFTPSINGSTEFLTYHPELFSSIVIHPSQLINPLPPISLLRYTPSISLLGCSTPCIVINFLVLLSKLFNSSVFDCRFPAPDIITETSQVLNAIILFPPFNFDLNISINHRRYSLLNFSFMSFSLILSVSNIPKNV